MGYYILVEKDAKVMQKCWKWIIVVVLTLILIACYLSSYAFQAFLQNFNGNCVTGASIVFKRIPTANDGFLSEQTVLDAEFHNGKIEKTYKEFRKYYLPGEMRSQQISELDDVPKMQIYDFLNNGPSIYRPSAKKVNSSKVFTTIPSNDIQFFQNYQIDEISTKWGDEGACSYFYYFPVIEVTMALLWIVFISISGRPGERRGDMFIHKSWRLVVPAVICFAVFAILCSVYAAYLNSRLNGFCNEFKQKFSSDELTCSFLLGRFSMRDDTQFDVDTNFNLAKSIAYIRIFLWLLAGFVMLLRCMLGADFEIEEIEHCTEQGGTAFDSDIDHPSKVKFIDDGIRRYSRERVYKPTTTTTTTATELQTIE